MKKKIAFITGSRAEYSLLKNLIKEYQNYQSKYSLKIIITGMHLQKKFGFTYKEIIRDFPNNYVKIKLNMPKDDDYSINQYISNGIKNISLFLKKNRFDFVYIAGDRTEIFAACIACYYMRIPVFHIHGGEVTNGSLDDSIRHSISKMSYAHFVSHHLYKKRLIQIGEDEKYIFNVGALAVDSINNFKFKNKTELIKKYNLKLKKKNLIVTFHPDTVNSGDNERQIKTLLSAISVFDDIYFLFTLPNNDAKNSIIISNIARFRKHYKNCAVVASLGQLDYFSTIKIFDGVIGNSSSGIIELPYLNKGIINIGNRQNGRIMSKKIINCKIEKKSIILSIKKLYSNKYINELNKNEKIFGTKNISKKIYEYANNLVIEKNKFKSFKDIKFKC